MKKKLGMLAIMLAASVSARAGMEWSIQMDMEIINPAKLSPKVKAWADGIVGLKEKPEMLCVDSGFVEDFGKAVSEGCEKSDLKTDPEGFAFKGVCDGQAIEVMVMKDGKGYGGAVKFDFERYGEHAIFEGFASARATGASCK